MSTPPLPLAHPAGGSEHRASPDPAPADGDLIAESRSRPERFSEIFDRHAQAVHRHLARRVGVAAADELTAETFLVAFRERNRYDTRHLDARPWLYGIAANLVRRAA